MMSFLYLIAKVDLLHIRYYMFLLTAGLPYVRFCVFLADGVGWVGVGWGGLMTFNGTSTHI